VTSVQHGKQEVFESIHQHCAFEEKEMTSNVAWKIPDYYPVPTAPHPQHEALKLDTVQWLERFSLCESPTQRDLFAETGTGVNTLLFLGTDYERLRFLNIYDTWSWIFQDRLFEDTWRSSDRPTSAFVDQVWRLARIADAPDAPPGNNLEAGWRDIVHNAHNLLTPLQAARFLDAQQHWFLGQAWDMSFNERQIIPTLADYPILRLTCVGAKVSRTLIQITHNLAVEERDLVSGPVAAAGEASMLLAAMINDVLSYPKEVAKQEAGLNHNLITALLHVRPELSVRKAVSTATGMINRLMTLYLRLREQIQPNAGYDLRRYTEGMLDVIAGTLSFNAQYARYFSAELQAAAAEYLSAWDNSPVDETLEPIKEFTSVAWWWDQLDR
jgi:hypothetical protein